MMDAQTLTRLKAQLEAELARLEAEVAELEREEHDTPLRGERREQLPRPHGRPGLRDVRARARHDARGERARRARRGARRARAHRRRDVRHVRALRRRDSRRAPRGDADRELCITCKEAEETPLDAAPTRAGVFCSVALTHARRSTRSTKAARARVDCVRGAVASPLDPGRSSTSRTCATPARRSGCSRAASRLHRDVAASCCS